MEASCCRAPTGRRALPRDSWKPMGDTTWVDVPVTVSGTYVIGASLLPRELALSAEDFNSYLKEDGIADILDARTRSGELQRGVRERYHKHVKAILQVGETRTASFGTALGHPAELVPLANPYSYALATRLPFALWWKARLSRNRS